MEQTSATQLLDQIPGTASVFLDTKAQDARMTQTSATPTRVYLGIVQKHQTELPLHLIPTIANAEMVGLELIAKLFKKN
jgi:hypothetical protein